MLAFEMFQQKIDEFLDFFLSDKNFCHVYDILKIICTLYHGHLSIERGFSINKEHFVENDHMLANILTSSNIQIPKAMLEKFKASNRCYKNKLQETRDA